MAGELKDKKVLVVDNGLFVSWAHTLARYGAKVDYFCPWTENAPKGERRCVGSGHKAFNRVDDWKRNGYDLYMFADLYFAEEVEQLRRDGKRVWGSGYGERLELDRWWSKKLMEYVGLQVNQCWRIKGIEALREFLQEHENVYVKVSQVRGEFESFKHLNYKCSDAKLTDIENNLGCRKHEQEFIIESHIESVCESGYDGWIIDGKTPESSLYGVEIKNEAYIGIVKPYKKLPALVRDCVDRLSDFFKRVRYRGQYSNEIRIASLDEYYLIDHTCRGPCPPTESQQQVFKNWDEIIWHGAMGEVVPPDEAAKYAIQACITSSEALKHDLPLYIDRDSAEWIKIFNHYRDPVKSVEYFVMQVDKQVEVGYVVGIGDTIKEAYDHLKKNAEGIEGGGVDVNLKAVPEAVEEIDKGQKAGIEFTDDPLPKLLK
jgi:hypothetical protein